MVHNGTAPPPPVTERRSPTLALVVGRLVPHKQIEHAIDAVVALRHEHPDSVLTVVGSGWWEDDLRKYVAEAGVGGPGVFEGHVPRTASTDPRAVVADAAALDQGGLGAGHR